MSSYFQLRMSYIPNAICILRIILVIPIIDFLWDKQYENALGLIAIAGISDFLDGFLAKKNNWRSKLGAALDPAADKILLVSLFLVLYLMDLISQGKLKAKEFYNQILSFEKSNQNIKLEAQKRLRQDFSE